MQHRIKSRQLRKPDIGTALNMTSDEKKVSFLNKFFIFKKIRDVDAAAVEKIQLNLNKEQEKTTAETNKELGEVVKNPVNEDKPRVKKLGKLKLKKATVVTAKPKIKIKRYKIKIKTPTTDARINMS